MNPCGEGDSGFLLDTPANPKVYRFLTSLFTKKFQGIQSSDKTMTKQWSSNNKKTKQSQTGSSHEVRQPDKFFCMDRDEKPCPINSDCDNPVSEHMMHAEIDTNDSLAGVMNNDLLEFIVFDSLERKFRNRVNRCVSKNVERAYQVKIIQAKRAISN